MKQMPSLESSGLSIFVQPQAILANLEDEEKIFQRRFKSHNLAILDTNLYAKNIEDTFDLGFKFLLFRH